MLSEKPLKIVVIGHETSLSGAPVLLFNLFSLIKENTKSEIKFTVHRDGPLTSLYRSLFKVIILKNSDYGKEKNILKRIVNFLNNKVQLLRLSWQVFNCDFIFSNTIVNGKIIRLLAIFNKPVITYVHELESVIQFYLNLGDAAFSLKGSDVFAFPSMAVKKVLAAQFKIPEAKLLPLNYYFPFQNQASLDSLNFDKVFWGRFGISDADFVVGGMGYASHRKGTDLFVEAFKFLYNMNKNVKFCWIGEFEDEEFKHDILRDIPEEILGKNLIFTGSLPHNFANFLPFDIFFLSSREDPYPLVVLEAAWMEKPSICFEGAGGIPEFIQDDAGWIIDKFNIEAVSNLIDFLFQNKGEIRLKAIAAKAKVIDLHGNDTLILEQFNKLLTQSIGEYE